MCEVGTILYHIPNFDPGSRSEFVYIIYDVKYVCMDLGMTSSVLLQMGTTMHISMCGFNLSKGNGCIVGL